MIITYSATDFNIRLPEARLRARPINVIIQYYYQHSILDKVYFCNYCRAKSKGTQRTLQRIQIDERYGEEGGNETGKVAIAHGSVEFCEATPIGLADES